MPNYINRTIEKLIEQMYGKFPAIMISGARQAGKSTVLQYIAAISKTEIKEVSLDDLNERDLAQSDPELFLRVHGTPLIIDEFQYAPGLLSYIKIAIDKARKDALFGSGKSAGTLYYLTGSQVFETIEGLTESLAGRIGIIDLHPLSMREICAKQEDIFVPDIQKLVSKSKVEYGGMLSLFERIFRGSYPELYRDRDMPLEVFFSSYVRTYIERDVRRIINIQDEPKFMKFISAMAARTGQEFNATDIAKDIEVSADTVSKWTSVLTNTYIIHLLQPHSNNNIARIIKRPKIYFMDTGLACYLTGYVSGETLMRSAYSGQIFETYVVSEIVKSYTNNGKDPKKHLYYYRDSNGKEIDLLVVNGDEIYPVEIKKSANPKKDAVKHFSLVDKFEMASPNGIVICLTEEVHALDNKNYMLPIEYI